MVSYAGCCYIQGVVISETFEGKKWENAHVSELRASSNAFYYYHLCLYRAWFARGILALKTMFPFPIIHILGQLRKKNMLDKDRNWIISCDQGEEVHLK